MGTTAAKTASRPELSPTEWVVLALLAETPTHGFAIAKELRPDSDLGRIITVHRPLVYRALDRLVGSNLAEPHSTERGDAGPNRTVHRATRSGRRAVDGWLDEPVAHIRDLRIGFLVKLRLNQRRGRDASALVAAQQAALASTFDQLITGDSHDIVDLWREHSAAAARDFLAHLACGTAAQ